MVLKEVIFKRFCVGRVWGLERTDFKTASVLGGFLK